MSGPDAEPADVVRRHATNDAVEALALELPLEVALHGQRLATQHLHADDRRIGVVRLPRGRRKESGDRHECGYASDEGGRPPHLTPQFSGHVATVHLPSRYPASNLEQPAERPGRWV
jgi:hypothetical protein